MYLGPGWLNGGLTQCAVSPSNRVSVISEAHASHLVGAPMPLILIIFILLLVFGGGGGYYYGGPAIGGGIGGLLVVLLILWLFFGRGRL